MQTRDVRGQKMPKNANVICEISLTQCRNWEKHVNLNWFDYLSVICATQNLKWLWKFEMTVCVPKFEMIVCYREFEMTVCHRKLEMTVCHREFEMTTCPRIYFKWPQNNWYLPPFKIEHLLQIKGTKRVPTSGQCTNPEKYINSKN